MGRGLGAESSFRRDRPLSALSARLQPRSAQFSSFRPASYGIPMNPLPNEWAITHRADVCAMTHRPFVPGEYFYTLLYHGADGYRREDLSEQAWQNRNENIQPFSFWKSRYELLPPKPLEPLPRENAEQLFHRLIASENAPANACYVLAVILARKRVLKQVNTEASTTARDLIYEHAATGDVFVLP